MATSTQFDLNNSRLKKQRGGKEGGREREGGEGRERGERERGERERERERERESVIP